MARPADAGDGAQERGAAMTAEDCENLLLIQAEFDGELDAAEAARAIHHRETCAVCRAAYVEFAATRSVLKSDAPYHRAPDNLRRALLAGLAAKAPQSPRRRTWWREAGGFAVGAALAASIALVTIAPQQQTLLDQVVASHIRALQPGHLEDVVSTDQHTVKPWFDGKLDFAPPVKDFATEKFPLLGGRLDYLDNRAVAALVYGRDKHLIDLYIWPAQGESAPTASVTNGYNAIRWTENGMSLWAVSDLEASQLQDFVRLWRTPS
jgi:anti-sigma factor RsiW